MAQGFSPSRSFFRFVLCLVLLVLITAFIIATFSFLNFFYLYERPELDVLEGKAFENTVVYESYIQENLWEITSQYDNTLIDTDEHIGEAETLEDFLLPGSTAVALDSPLLTSAGRIDYYQPLPADNIFGGRDLDAIIYHRAGRIVFSHLPWEELKPLLRTMNFDAVASVRTESGIRQLDLYESTYDYMSWNELYKLDNLLSRSVPNEDLARVLPEYEEWLESDAALQEAKTLSLFDYSQSFSQSNEQFYFSQAISPWPVFTSPELEDLSILEITYGPIPYARLRVDGFIHLLPNEALRSDPGSLYRIFSEKHDLAARFLTTDTVLIIAVIFLAILLLFVHLTLRAGLTVDRTYEAALLDRIPHEIVLLSLGFIIFLSFSSAEYLIRGLPYPRSWEFYVGAVLVIFILLSAILTYWLTFIRRLRTKTFIKTSWLLSLLRYLWRMFRRGVMQLRRNRFGIQLLFYVAAVLVGFYIILRLTRDSSKALIFVLTSVSAYTLYHLNGLGVIRSEVEDLLKYPVDQVKKSSIPPHYSDLQDDIYRLAEAQNLAAEEQIRAERLKAELITNVSHDLRTPLTSLVSYTELLQRNELPEDEQSEYLAVVVEKIKLLRQITENLLDISRASSRNQAIHLVSMDLTEFMRQVWAEHEGAFVEKDLDLILEITGGGQAASFDAYEWARALKEEPAEEPLAPEPVMVMADPKSLQRVMLNLFDNALKYALEGSRVFFSLNADDEKAEISLRNISREPLRRRGDELIERFVREESSRTSEGSGLGLAIAQSLSEAMEADFKLNLEDDRFEAKLTLKRFVEGPVEEI